MNLQYRLSSTLLVLAAGALFSGCAGTPSASSGRCDTTQSLGTCSVRVEQQGSRLVVCPDSSPAAATPVCMAATLDVKRPGRKPQQTRMLLQPGQCVPLNTEISSAASSSCQAFAAGARTAAK